MKFLALFRRRTAQEPRAASTPAQHTDPDFRFPQGLLPHVEPPPKVDFHRYGETPIGGLIGATATRHPIDCYTPDYLYGTAIPHPVMDERSREYRAMLDRVVPRGTIPSTSARRGLK